MKAKLNRISFNRKSQENGKITRKDKNTDMEISKSQSKAGTVKEAEKIMMVGNYSGCTSSFCLNDFIHVYNRILRNEKAMNDKRTTAK